MPIYRNNKLEDVYWTVSYSPAFWDDDQIARVLVTCRETTQEGIEQEKAAYFVGSDVQTLWN